jgi:hypothetical protein
VLAVLAACGVLADGNRGAGAPGCANQGGRGKTAGSPSRTCAGAACLIGWLRGGQKIPRKAGLGAISRRSAGTPSSGGGSNRVAPATRRAFQSCKLRDNRPNSSLKIAKLGRGPAFKQFWSTTCGALATIRQFLLLGDFLHLIG